MQNVVFSRQDDSIVGLDRPAVGAGEYTVELPYPIKLSKAVSRIDGERQKTNDAGQLLYKDNVQKVTEGQESYEEVAEARKVTGWEEVSNTYTLVGEDGSKEVTTTTQLPIEWIDLQPVMVPNEVTTYISFDDTPTLFTYDELIAAKVDSLKRSCEGSSLIFYDEDFPIDHFSGDIAGHSANMGDGFFVLHPLGSCRTVKLQLGKSTDTIKLYLEAQPDVTVSVAAKSSDPYIEFVDGVATLPAAADAVYVRFTNSSDRYREVSAFGLMA